MRCSACGEENQDRAKFCWNCGGPLGPTEGPRHEVRKTVTVLFCDVTGSTAIGERLDPESLRRVMERYFESMRAPIEHHGGTVEKFIGDAVMAVFGIPRTHEDDALRAVRAAIDMATALTELNVKLRAEHGIEVVPRTGINTGEVVASGAPEDRQRLVTGDTVNVAARLEQAAAPGEILLGRESYRLVRDAVEVEPVDPLELKGKTERVPAFRLVSVDEQAAVGITRRQDTSFVGRTRELRVLADAYERTVAEASSSLVTVPGVAGVGKSRLTAEAITNLAPAPATVSGRCLPYGDGITFWPIVEIVKQACGIADDDPPDVVQPKILELVHGEDDAALVASHVSSLLGVAPQPGSLEEVRWAVRRFLETLAIRGPVVAVVDDLHWAEPALLDLIEHVSDYSRGFPLLLVGLARPEFLDQRPGWGGGKMNATTILVEPLDEQDGSALVADLLGSADLDPVATAQLVRAAEGNPLFLEELLSMLVDEGILERIEGHVRQVRSLDAVELPASIQVLLAARLDRLDAAELAVVEGAAVVGQVFYRGAVTELAPEALRPDVSTYLSALVRKDLVRPERGGFPGDETFRFRHVLLRDAAYRAMPKQTRAELHERFAEWLDRIAGARLSEYEEILAYHLERAFLYERELGNAERRAGLAERASARLLSCARRARERGDSLAAASFFERSADISPDDAAAGRALGELGYLLVALGRDGEGQAQLAAADERARRSGEPAAQAYVRVLQAAASETFGTADELRRICDEAIGVFEGVNDDRGSAFAWNLRANVSWAEAQAEASANAWRRAAEYAERAGDRIIEAEAWSWIAIAAWFGPNPSAEIRRATEQARARIPNQLVTSAQLQIMEASLLGADGRFDEAMALADESDAALRAAGLWFWAAHFVSQVRAEILEFQGLHAEAGRTFMQVIAEIEDHGQTDEFLQMLAARHLALSGDPIAAGKVLPDPAIAQPFVQDRLNYGMARSAIAYASGDPEAAEAAAREGLRALEESDFVTQRAQFLEHLADALDLRGDAGGAAEARGQAAAIFEMKGWPVTSRSSSAGSRRPSSS
jgi:class 3 adenylate cyclase